ncbi:MAG: peptidoglycan editing factor PgeF [Deltaproteobacteria bacterium]|nr:peptidoglycan editing factor PgeF [Deltaproteobacteria bacterium]
MIPFEPFDKIRGAFLGAGYGDLSGEFFEVKQVHGDGVVVLREARDVSENRGKEADAVICARWAVPIAVRTADCVPVFIAHPKRVIAVVHAGWRGTVAGILEKTLLRMRESFDLDLSEAALAVGPAIGPECYEVGEDVAAAFRGRGDSVFLKELGQGKFALDLKAANAAQARRLGVAVENIELRPECTRCEAELFHSHRAALARGEAKAGRNYSWLMISP